MLEIHPENAADYVRRTRAVPPSRRVEARALGWGVSNIVLDVAIEGEAPFVLKQSRARLRTKMEWISRIDRIWNEVAALELLGAVLGDDAFPRVLFVDRENYAFAMSRAPEGSRVWKEALLDGDLDPNLARRAGALLAAAHAELEGRPELDRGPLADVEVFDQLRVDPFYRTLARAHPDLKPPLDALAESMLTCDAPTFVHADFSPKNILVAPDGRLTVVDFETAHKGDRAFDVGFFLSHLFLKAVRSGRPDPRGIELARAAWSGYVERAGGVAPELSTRSARHLAACSLARVDGKSPVDYLSESAVELVRGRGREFLLDGSGNVDAWIDIT